MLLESPPQREVEVSHDPSGDASPRRRPAVILAAAVALLAIPSAVGFTLLRSDGSEVPTATQDLVVIQQSASGSEVGSSDLLQPAETAERSRLRYLDTEGTAVEFQNGSSIPLADDLGLEVFVSPYPPDTFDVSVDFYLTDARGEPVTDAEISVVWDMIFMTHGPFLVSPEHIGGGHYVTSYDFFMFGPWELDAAISRGTGAEAQAVLAIYVWPV